MQWWLCIFYLFFSRRKSSINGTETGDGAPSHAVCQELSSRVYSESPVNHSNEGIYSVEQSDNDDDELSFGLGDLYAKPVKLRKPRMDPEGTDHQGNNLDDSHEEIIEIDLYIGQWWINDL